MTEKLYETDSFLRRFTATVTGCTQEKDHWLVTLDRTRRCDPQRLLAGVYEARTNTGRRLLRLKPDYTFSETQFTESGEETSAGRWWRSAELELVLEETSPGTSEQSFQLIPPQEALTRNSGGGPLVYKKVYL